MLALTENGKIIHIKDAQKGINYRCDKCGGILKVKDGKIRMKHFYHLKNNCGSKGESLIHKYWKEYFCDIKEFDGYKIIHSKAEVSLLKGSYIPDVLLKTDQIPTYQRYKKFKIYLQERLAEMTIKSTVFYINIYDYENLKFHKEGNGNFLGELYSKDEKLQGNISVFLASEK